MGLYVNQIGKFTFDHMIGEIAPSREQVEIFQRPGVDGLGFRTYGKRGQPFQVETRRYEASDPLARAVRDLYLELIGTAPVKVAKRSVLQSGLFKVLDVSTTSIAQRTSVVGSTIVLNPTVVLICQWTLVASS